LELLSKKELFLSVISKEESKKEETFNPRLKHSPKETLPGYIEMDTVTIWALCKKYYFVTAIDIVTKFAWVKLVVNPSSRSAKEALVDFIHQYKHSLRVVQTDNGSEFLGEFDEYLQKTHVKHEFIFQKSPKINGIVERFNRTIQEEFIERNDEYMYDQVKFNQKLYNYLIWYNTRRPHYSLGQLSPTEYMQRFR